MTSTILLSNSSAYWFNFIIPSIPSLNNLGFMIDTAADKMAAGRHASAAHWRLASVHMAADGVGGTLVAYQGRINAFPVGNTYITYLMTECPSCQG